MAEQPDYLREIEYRHIGAVIGVDEAGRGPWAGPVTAAAFWINPAQLARLPASLTDSKKLSKSRHQKLRSELVNPEYGHQFSVQHIASAQIDEIGILPATFLAMQRAVASLSRRLIDEKHQIAHILVDGNLCPEFDWPASTIIKGDSKSLSIAAASIIAKTERDALMQALARDYPDYGWQRNAGYGTVEHHTALKTIGVSPHHRKSYAPIKALLQP